MSVVRLLCCASICYNFVLHKLCRGVENVPHKLCRGVENQVFENAGGAHVDSGADSFVG